MKEIHRIRPAECGSFIVDRRGTILGFDQALEELTGWPAIEVVGRNKELGRIEGVPLYDGDIPMLETRRSLELTLHCRDGRSLEVEAIASHMAGPGDRMLVTILRVLALSAGETVGEQQDRHDPLTTLPNAETFAVRLAAEFSTAASTARPLALVLADIDHLREINDRLGHRAGDEVLSKVAGILRVIVDDDAMIARLGDDDFAILLPGSGRGEARQLAAGLRSAVERYQFFQNEDEEDRTRVTLSLGSASFPADAERASDLMERARDALDEARVMGRNRVWCYLRRPRVPLEVPVFFEGAESLLVGYTRDLSPSGIFVQTSVPIEIGMRCALAFPLPGRDSKVHVIGRVVRSVPPEMSSDSQETRVPGMGVEFERFGGSTDRHAIESFLHSHESTTLRPENGILSV
jgi:diguanylate cyclase (GGDEF)-like protein